MTTPMPTMTRPRAGARAPGGENASRQPRLCAGGAMKKETRATHPGNRAGNGEWLRATSLAGAKTGGERQALARFTARPKRSGPTQNA
jgi:hypothetical protein